MTPKYEVIVVQNAEITVDVSLLAKTEEMFFNATDMAKSFGKRPDDFWKQSQNREYLDALVTLSEGNKDDFVFTKRGGRYQGTWLHKDMALQFARWLSPLFAVQIDKWTVARLRQEHEWKQNRLEAKTGFIPMADAISHAHDPVHHYHFSNEADMINRIVLGMSAKQFRETYDVPNVRDAADASQLAEINRLQIINTGLIEIGMEYAERKHHLEDCYRRGLLRHVQDKAA